MVDSVQDRLRIGVAEIESRAALFDHRQGYFDGDQRLPYAPPGVSVEYLELRRQALASPMTRVVRAPGGVTVPGFLVDKSCTMLRAGLAGKWHKKRIQGSDGRFGEEPVKNQWSHPCDAASYLCSTFGEHALLIERHDAAATDRGRAFQQARAGVAPMAMKVDFSGMFPRR